MRARDRRGRFTIMALLLQCGKPSCGGSKPRSQSRLFAAPCFVPRGKPRGASARPPISARSMPAAPSAASSSHGSSCSRECDASGGYDFP